MVVITGASDGLGLQIAKVFSDAGVKVVNLSRSESKYASVNIKTDLRIVTEINAAAQQISEFPEPITAIINCAGVLSFQKIGSITSDELNRVLEVNIRAPILLISALSDRLIADQSDILNVASTVGLKAYPDQSSYVSSKWAIRGFSQTLQLELKDTNRVISFCIGGFKSDIAKKVTGKSLPDPENWMNPEDIAVFVKQILDLPKSMEVSEIVINRKPAKKEN